MYSNRRIILAVADDDFPDDLRDAQLRLHQARSAYRALCRELPWSVEPAEGWTGEEGHYSSYRREFPASPGWSEEQRAEEVRLRELVLTLSIEVSTHPYWAGLDGPDVVRARMALKHAGGGSSGAGRGPGGDGTVSGSAHGPGGDGSASGGAPDGGGDADSGDGSGGDGTAGGSPGDDSGGSPPMSSAAA